MDNEIDNTINDAIDGTTDNEMKDAMNDAMNDAMDDRMDDAMDDAMDTMWCVTYRHAEILWKALEAGHCHHPDETVANRETSCIYSPIALRVIHTFFLVPSIVHSKLALLEPGKLIF